MRTTRAIHAVERLKTRSGNPRFAAVSLSGGLFYLVDKSSGTDQKVSDPLPLDDFETTGVGEFDFHDLASRAPK